MNQDKKSYEEDYERFNSFEDKLMTVETAKWREDEDIQSQVHLDILKEKFGEERVQEILVEKNVGIKYLSNHGGFLEIFNMLNK